MKQVNRFFWFCSGVHVDTLKKYPIELNKYVGIGATIFFTALFAALSGGYAMYFVFSGSTGAQFFAVLFGLIWGAAIFNMDRYIVGSINKRGTINSQILQATPRILLAIMIGIVISRPLELKIFDKEIRSKLKTAYLKGQRSKIDTMNITFNKKYGMDLSKAADIKAERDSLQKDIARSRYQLNQEIFGDKTNQTSGKTGFGTYAKQKDAVLKEKEARLNTVREDQLKTDQYISNRKNVEGVTDTKLFNDRQLDSLANVAGFADRNWALGQLSYNQNGTRELDTYLAQSFISYLFILFECLPVLVKLMSPRGPYDVALGKTEEANLHFAEKDMEQDISVTDAVQDHRINTNISLSKNSITKRAERKSMREDLKT